MILALRLAIGLLTALAILVPAAPSAAAEEQGWSRRDTEHFALRYRADDAAEVDWYAAAAEQSYQFLSELFGYRPAPGIALVFHADEASYVEMNPLAGREEAVLAHARPSAREIGLALWRLRRQSETLRRDAIRHELTHVVLGELSENRLPIGFHEGIAQYVEQDAEQRAKLVRNLRRGAEGGQLLSFADLNRQRAFLSKAAMSYPQSYSVVAYLNDAYGLGHVVRLALAMRETEDLDQAAVQVFGRSLGELETEWRGYLPSFLDGTWSRNDLDLWELAEPRRLFAEGRYADARDGFGRAARLFEDLGRPEKLDQARRYLTQSEAGLAALDLDQRGAAALERHEYAVADELLGQAGSAWSVVGDEARGAVARAGRDEALRGMEAETRLASARTLLESWQLGEARTAALQAGATFADLGDEERMNRAEAVLADARDLQTRMGTAAVAAGVVGMGAVAMVWSRARRERRDAQSPRPDPVGAAPARDWSL